MVRRETVNWDLPVAERLNQADVLARLYGTPNFWYWRDTPKNGHELVMVWLGVSPPARDTGSGTSHNMRGRERRQPN